jgi:hypothetical protein
VSLSHTLIVSPNGTPPQNGTALLTAMSLISNSNPSATNPWLIKVEPGQYDLGANSLVLLPYVDLEGSGEDTTLISSTVGANTPVSGTLVLASHSQARFLSVANSGSQDFQIAVLVSTNATQVSLLHLTASAVGTSSNLANNAALFNSTAITLSVQNSSFSASGPGVSNNVGFDNEQGTIIIQNSTITAAGVLNPSAAIYNNSGTINIQGSVLNASSANGSYGVNNAGSVIVQSSSINVSGSGSSSKIGLYNYFGTVIVHSSVISVSGSTNANYGVLNNIGTVRVGASELSATTPAGYLSGTTNTCVASYKGDFSPLGATCN